MKVAFVYDDQENYGVSQEEYADFCINEEAIAIVNSISEIGHDVHVFKGKDKTIDLLCHIRDYDIVFNKMEGFASRNREGLLPACLEMFDIPYVGTDSYGFSVSLNKHHTKLIAIDRGIPTPRYVLVRNQDDIGEIEKLSYPLFVKPNNEGSSIGCQIIRTPADDVVAIVKGLLTKFHQPILVEEYISGIDISVPIIGNGQEARCLGTVSFIYPDGSHPEITTTSFKYYEQHTSVIQRFKEDMEQELFSYSLNIFSALGCSDYARVDFRVNEKGIFFLEINPLPTLCPGGAFDVCAQAQGKSLSDLIISIFGQACKRYNLGDQS